EHVGLKTGPGRQSNRRHFEDIDHRHAIAEAPLQGVADRNVVADRSEHDLGFSMRRYDVRRHTAADEADRVGSRSQLRIWGPLVPAQGAQNVDTLFDRRLTELRIARMRGAPGGAKLHTVDAARGQAETILGGLAVDEKV